MGGSKSPGTWNPSESSEVARDSGVLRRTQTPEGVTRLEDGHTPLPPPVCLPQGDYINIDIKLLDTGGLTTLGPTHAWGDLHGPTHVGGR